MLPDNNQTLFHRLALTFVKDIGPRRARTLLAHFGGAEEIFGASPKEIKQVEGFSEALAKTFKDTGAFEQAEKELNWVQKHGVSVLWQDDEAYPSRLKNCVDAPVLLYYKGNADLNTQKIVAVIGTRKSTDYGHRLTEELINGLKNEENIIITSGLAHGIDAHAHKDSLNAGLSTVGVLGHGLDRIYPATNKALAKDMVVNGGLLTEFPSGTLPDELPDAEQDSCRHQRRNHSC